MINFKFSQLLLISIILSSQNLYADQASYLSKQVAQKAASLIRTGQEIRDYCKPCGDEGFKRIFVNNKAVVYTGDENYYQVMINGIGIDLAYT